MVSGKAQRAVQLYDYEPEIEDFGHEVRQGLMEPPRTLPCKFFYDERGSKLFEQICELDEYYLTRTELSIVRENTGEIAEAIGPNPLIIEYGSGSGIKIRILLSHLNDPAGYIPVDISREHLLRSAQELAEDFVGLDVFPVCADFTKPFELPAVRDESARAVVYFPGSTIGNFTPEEACDLLRSMARVCGVGSGLVIGVDLKKDVTILEAAYNDNKNVTKDFNLNLLARVNRELNADFQIDQFRHEAFYNESKGRVEMHLVSEKDQTVRIGEDTIHFSKGENIHTENSHKYSLKDFESLASRAGMSVQNVWMDENRWFSVQYLTVESV